jgi:hypothetical protein
MENSPAANNIFLYKNGSAIIRQHVERWSLHNYEHGWVQGVVKLNKDDYLEIWLICNDGIVSGISDSVNWWMGHLL